MKPKKAASEKVPVRRQKTEGRNELLQSAIAYSLRRASIFEGLPEEDLGRIAGYAILQTLAKGEYLFRENDPARGFYVVRRGIVNIHRVAADGREQVIHLFRAGDSFAEMGLVDTQGYPADARAVVASEVILIPKTKFLAHQRGREDLAWRMVTSLTRHLRSLVATLESLRLKDAETRFLHWVLQRCSQRTGATGQIIEIGMSKAALAGELGTRQETLSRIFARLRDANLLEIRNQQFLVRDLSGLRQLFEKNLGTPAEGGPPPGSGVCQAGRPQRTGRGDSRRVPSVSAGKPRRGSAP